MISAHKPVIQVRGHTIGKAMTKEHENKAKDENIYKTLFEVRQDYLHRKTISTLSRMTTLVLQC